MERTSQALGAQQYLGYAAGDAANNLTFSMVSAFLLIYYTDVAGISAAMAGTILLVVRVWGGVSDLVAGGCVDQTSTRWGRFRPYMLFGALPLMLLLVAVFTIPSGLGDTGKVVWALASYAVFQLAYSFVTIPYGSLAAAMTQNPDERAKLSTSRLAGASVTILVLALVVSPQIEGAGNLQRSLTITTAIFAVFGVALYLWCFTTSRETVPRSIEQPTLVDTFRMLRHNKPLILLSLASLVFLAGQFSLQTVAVYYARDVLGDARLYIWLTLSLTTGLLVSVAITPRTIRRIGKKRTFVLGAVIGAVLALGVALAPASVPLQGILVCGLMGVPLGLISTLIWALQADTVDYGEWRSGIRAEGASYSVLSFMRKAGQGVGGAAAAYAIGAGGYVAGAAVQADSAITAVRVAVGGIPAASLLVAGALMIAYPLAEKRYRHILEEIAVRRAARPPAG